MQTNEITDFDIIKRTIVGWWDSEEQPEYIEVARVVDSFISHMKQIEKLPNWTALVCQMAIDVLEYTNVQNNFTENSTRQLDEFRRV